MYYGSLVISIYLHVIVRLHTHVNRVYGIKRANIAEGLVLSKTKYSNISYAASKIWNSWNLYTFFCNKAGYNDKEPIHKGILLHLVFQVIWPNPVPNLYNHEVIADSL